MKTIANIFKPVVNYKSGIGQMTKKGLREVEVKRITVNKNVHQDFRKLNNHHGIISHDDDNNGVTLVTMFTSQENSKALIEGQTTKDINHLVASNENISNNRTKDQYLSDLTIKFNPGTSKQSPSETGEKFTKKYAERISDILNSRFKEKILEVKDEIKTQ